MCTWAKHFHYFSLHYLSSEIPKICFCDRIPLIFCSFVQGSSIFVFPGRIVHTQNLLIFNKPTFLTSNKYQVLTVPFELGNKEKYKIAVESTKYVKFIL